MHVSSRRNKETSLYNINQLADPAAGENVLPADAPPLTAASPIDRWNWKRTRTGQIPYKRSTKASRRFPTWTS